MRKNLNILAQRIKDQISKGFAPITVTGSRGSGKTRLLWLVERSVRPALWHHDDMTDQMKSKLAKEMDAGELFEKMLDAIKSGKSNSWTNEFEPYMCIIIDNFDKLEGKKLSQEMLIDYLYKSLKPIVIASKCMIKGDGFIEELVDYFRGGITIQLNDPTKEEKLEHFEALLACMELEIEEEALLWIRNQEFISYTATHGYLRTLEVVSTQSPITYEICVANASNYII